MTISEIYQLLYSPNLQIADTGATIQNTPHSLGLKQMRKGAESDSVAVGNEEKMKSKYLGSIKGAVANNKGQVMSNVTLKDLAPTPQSRFNLLSISKMMGHGQ